MELLDIKIGTLALLIVITNLLPDPLTDLVARCLTWPAEVTCHLKIHKFLAFHGVLSHKVFGILKVPVTGTDQLGLAKVNPDVENDARCPHALAKEHSKAICRVVQIPKLFHQALGIEGPTFTVSGGP